MRTPFENMSGDSLSFIGTATTLLRLGPFTVLTDPNFLHQGQWSYFGQGLFSRRRTEPAAQPADLPPLSAVVLSHLHGDHFDRVARRELDRDVPILTTGHAARQLGRGGFRACHGLRTWSTETLTDGGATLRVTAVPARHAAGALNLVLPEVMGTVLEYWSGHQATPLRVYVSGDTVIHGDLMMIRERFPSLDLAVLHLGGTRFLGVLLSMDHKQGVDLIELLNPERAVPVHYDDYGLFTSPISNFLAEVRDRQPATAVHLLPRGGSLSLARDRHGGAHTKGLTQMAHDELPLPGFDQLPLADLRHRIRQLDKAQLETLVDHEHAHGDRVPVLELLRSRLDELAEGAEPSAGDPDRTPPVAGRAGDSPVQPDTAAENTTPLRHGVAEQTPSRGKP